MSAIIKQIVHIFTTNIMADNSLVMAIIAINMTVIGLTSLADKKTVIGIDYGEFLMKEFKIMKIRMYHWLILFALINIISLFTMFIGKPIIRNINFFFLILSLIFAIYYFFRFILIENKYVVKKVYIRELLGLYRDSNNIEHLYVDKLVGMNPGISTSGKISTDVINYFSNYNGNTKKAFKEVFGPDSIIYSNKKSIIKARKKFFKTNPYKYRVSDKNKSVKEISFEFFQLFRFVEHQERWALDILLVLNGETNNDKNPKNYKNPDNYEDYDIYRLYNFARLSAQIVLYGISQNLFKYKFLLHYHNYWYMTVDKQKVNVPQDTETIQHIKSIEEDILKSLFKYISKTINNYKDRDFIDMVHTLLKEIILKDRYKGFLLLNEIVILICEISYTENCNDLQDLIEKTINMYIDDCNKNEIKLDEVHEHISKIKKENNNNATNKITIFERT